MERPTCPTCTPVYKPFPSGKAWAHSMKCKDPKKRGQKIVTKTKVQAITPANARQERIRSQRHMAETAKTGLGLTTTKTFPRGIGLPPIPLIAPGKDCPAHEGEPRAGLRGMRGVGGLMNKDQDGGARQAVRGRRESASSRG